MRALALISRNPQERIPGPRQALFLVAIVPAALGLVFSSFPPQAASAFQDGGGDDAHTLELIAAAQSAAKEFAKHHPLAVDDRLHSPVIVAEARSGIRALLNRLELDTNLRFHLSDGLAKHDPDFGDLDELGELRAYTLMEIIAECDLDDGCWEKVEGGYRLTGTLRTPLPPSRFRWWWAAIPAAFFLAAAFVVYRRRGKVVAQPTGKA